MGIYQGKLCRSKKNAAGSLTALRTGPSSRHHGSSLFAAAQPQEVRLQPPLDDPGGKVRFLDNVDLGLDCAIVISGSWCHELDEVSLGPEHSLISTRRIDVRKSAW